MERGGRRFIIDLHTQMVGEDIASLDSKGGGGEDEGKKRMEPDKEGVLKLDGESNDDDLDSLNGLLHRQMEDYELFWSYHMIRVEEGSTGEEKSKFSKEYTEV